MEHLTGGGCQKSGCFNGGCACTGEQANRGRGVRGKGRAKSLFFYGSPQKAPQCLETKSSQRQVLKIRPTAEWAFFDISELWSYRDLLWTLAARDIKLRYRQTALGILWVVFQPVAGAGVFSLVFGWVAGLGQNQRSYFLFSLAGLLVWNAFQSTLGKASMALLGNASLVSKVYFPRLLLPLSTILSTLVDFGIGLVVFAATAIITGHTAPWSGMLMLPVWLGAALGGATGAGLLAASVMTRFRDVQHVLPLLMPFLMYASPVAYGVAAVPPEWQSVFYWNPMTWILEGTRAALLGTNAVPGIWGAVSVFLSTFTLAVGVICFRRMERSFADVL